MSKSFKQPDKPGKQPDKQPGLVQVGGDTKHRAYVQIVGEDELYFWGPHGHIEKPERPVRTMAEVMNKQRYIWVQGSSDEQYAWTRYDITMQGPWNPEYARHEHVLFDSKSMLFCYGCGCLYRYSYGVYHI